jgi:hypothetical protein
MKTRITSHQDLIQQRLELQRQLEFKRAQIREDFAALKEEVSPALKVASVIGKVTTRESRSNVVLQTGANLAIDWATRKLFPKANFLIKLIAPVLVKNYASHFLGRKNKNASTPVAG